MREFNLVIQFQFSLNLSLILLMQNLTQNIHTDWYVDRKIFICGPKGNSSTLIKLGHNLIKCETMITDGDDRAWPFLFKRERERESNN